MQGLAWLTMQAYACCKPPMLHHWLPRPQLEVPLHLLLSTLLLRCSFSGLPTGRASACVAHLIACHTAGTKGSSASSPASIRSALVIALSKSSQTSMSCQLEFWRYDGKASVSHVKSSSLPLEPTYGCYDRYSTSRRDNQIETVRFEHLQRQSSGDHDFCVGGSVLCCMQPACGSHIVVTIVAC